MANRFSVVSTAALLLLTFSQTACGGGGGGGGGGAVTPPVTPPEPTPEVSPAVYFSKEANGIGDPNPFFENGVFTVVYLKNEGRHPFWSTQSPDGLSWSNPTLALSVGESPAADLWIGSGSVIADPAGGYRLFYTGHNPGANPKEITMQAKATSLSGPWTKTTGFGFAGTPQYDALDFRDPFVFWNSETNSYWMLLTTRQAGKAVIGRYTSPDLNTWTAEAPLYSEDSPLNLEVPDLFKQCGRWNLIYSDQRSTSRQVRVLNADQSTGPYAYRAFDALDGKAFYAGKTAGTNDNRLLFGWLAHKRNKTDAGTFDWGGDLVTHAIKCRSDGELAVQLPQSVAQQFAVERKSLSIGNQAIGDGAKATLTHIDVRVTPGDEFGFSFKRRNSDLTSQIRIDTQTGQAKFFLNGGSAEAPSIAFPPSSDGNYSVDLVLDPKLGLGIVYINAFRALSFRYYDVRYTDVSVYSKSAPLALTGTVRERNP
ncbi:hypothetical protein [Asticcacaulis sp.]|uniref:hypothetical protein n=1 Tax=Asticcacaulis sp. TaxID=1872648 RepID=UPI0031D7F409